MFGTRDAGEEQEVLADMGEEDEEEQEEQDDEPEEGEENEKAFDFASRATEEAPKSSKSTKKTPGKKARATLGPCVKPFKDTGVVRCALRTAPGCVSLPRLR